MKKIVLITLLSIGFFGLTDAQKGKKSKKAAQKEEEKQVEIVADGVPKIKFNETNHDFGNITDGTQATFTFEFVNTGNAPLLLESVQASCGCTTPEWSKEPVAPGKKGKVTATFNSSGRPGTFTKTITVKYNGPAESNTEYLTIKGFVEQAPVTPQTPVVTPNN